MSDLPSINNASYAGVITRHPTSLEGVDEVRMHRHAAMQKVERVVAPLLGKENNVSHEGELNGE